VNMVKIAVHRQSLLGCFAATCVAFLAGCGTMSEEIAAVMPESDALASSTDDVAEAWRGDGYPDLRAIPPMPTNQRDPAAWNQFQAGLVQAGGTLNADPRATLATEVADEATWAGAIRAQVAADPKFGPPPAWMRDLEWQQSIIARMNRTPR
jgi:hypothetical protein